MLPCSFRAIARARHPSAAIICTPPRRAPRRSALRAAVAPTIQSLETRTLLSAMPQASDIDLAATISDTPSLSSFTVTPDSVVLGTARLGQPSSAKPTPGQTPAVGPQGPDETLPSLDTAATGSVHLLWDPNPDYLLPDLYSISVYWDVSGAAGRRPRHLRHLPPLGRRGGCRPNRLLLHGLLDRSLLGRPRPELGLLPHLDEQRGLDRRQLR